MSGLVRRDDWQGRLSASIVAALETPFEWGVHDCALFAADAVLAMTDTDLAAGVRGRYRTRTGAARVLRAMGHSDVGSLAAAELREIPVALASAGDIAILDGPEGLMLAVVGGALLMAPGPTGLSFAPREAALRAFHLPFAGEDA